MAQRRDAAPPSGGASLAAASLVASAAALPHLTHRRPESPAHEQLRHLEAGAVRLGDPIMYGRRWHAVNSLSFLATLSLLAGCGDSVAPERRDAGVPSFVEIGSRPAIRGVGTLGTGTATAGSDRQEFDFDVAADLSGRFFYRDWRFSATITVSPTDPETRITAFRTGASACAAPDNGAEFDAIGRRESGVLLTFTVIACDDGAAGSGADGFSITTATQYSNAGRLASGDIVKTVQEPAPMRATGQGHVGPGSAVPGQDRLEFDFEATSAPSGRVVVTDYSVVRLDGTPGRMIADPATDPATSVTSFSQTSATCVRFGGVGRINDDNQLFAFFVDACDNATPGAGADDFAINLPLRPYSKGGKLSGGDIVISSTAPSPTTGTLSITSATSGGSQPASYTITATGPSFPTGTTATIGASATLTNTVTAGSYTVTLDGVPSNCTVASGTSRTVTVPAGGTGTVSYSVMCTTPPGDLKVNTSSSGSSIPSSYTVTVDGSLTRTIASTGTVTFSSIAAASHTVVLAVPSNCSVSGGATRTVTVPSGGTATVSYSVSCTTPPGDLKVNASSSGSSIPSSYTVTVDGSLSKTIPSTGSATYTGLTAGSHTVVLAVPSNCAVSGGASRTVTVLASQTITVTYSVSCVSPNAAPVVNAGPDQTALVGLLYGLTVSFSDANHNGPWSYTIDWGDGSRTSGTRSSEGTISAGHTYFVLLPRSFTVRVTVVDAAGAVGSDTKVVTVLLL